MLKTIVFLPHIICLILGGILLAFGVNIHENFATNAAGYTCSYAFICIGIVPYLFFIFLCVGYTFRNSCCIITFIVLHVLALIAQILLAYILKSEADSMGSNLSNIIDISWEYEGENPGAMSIYESTYNCCGRASPHDYIKDGRIPPSSCFIDGQSNPPENLYEIGCRTVFKSYILKLLYIYTILSWILVALETIVILLSCALLCSG